MPDPAPDAVHLRPAQRSDIPALGPIELAGDAMFVAAGHLEFGSGDHITDAEANDAIARGDLAVAVAGEGSDDDETVLGWVLVGDTGAEPSIDQICVDPAAQGAGVGSRLIAWAIERVRDSRPTAATVVLSTQADIAWNRPWYERLGFVVVSPQDWTDAMRSVTEHQQSAGLDWMTRVHMRAVLADLG